MKKEIELCSLAFNPASPSPTANMVKVENGFMTSYGGTFCIRAPMPIEVGACFDPTSVKVFFRKERKAVSYKLHKNKLVIQEGKEKLSVRYLPPEEMVTLDAFGEKFPAKIPMDKLKLCSDVVNPAHYKLCAQGVQFRYGAMEATNGNVLVSADSGVDEDIEFNLPVASVKALLKFKTSLDHIVVDTRAVKFVFEDGSSLTSLTICEELLEVGAFFSGKWTPLNIKPAAFKDLFDIDCDKLIFHDGSVEYTKGVDDGSISGITDKGFDVCVMKKSFDFLLHVGIDIAVSEDKNRFQAFSDTCRAICSASR